MLWLLSCSVALASLPRDSLARLDYTALANRWGHVVDGAGYAYDPLGLRTNVTRHLGLTTNTVAVGYDAIGQLTSWSAKETNGTLRLNEQFGFGYDPAHNLTSRISGALVQTFNVDALNQLTNITRTGTLTVSGDTPVPATNVTVNGQAAAIYGDFTFARTNLALTDGTNTFTIIARNIYGHAATNVLNVNLPASVALQYDLNGSLTSDGTRWFAYDTDSRLVSLWVTNAWRSDFVYDGLGRRRIERDYGWNTSAWLATNEIHYIYDGYLPIQERWFNPQLSTNNPQQVVTYTRGADLSGGLGTAGGIGGLLALTQLSTNNPQHFYYHADGAGNITDLVDGNENMAARYLYGPFGRLTAQWGTMAGTNAMQFSSMPRHGNSGLSLYPFRGYDPTFQRWLTRDLIGESGGINLYGFVGNSPVNEEDPFGLTHQPGDFGWGMYTVTLPTVSPPTPKPAPAPTTFMSAAPPSSGTPIPISANSLPNPFTYDALLIGANHLLDTPIGYQLAQGNALNNLSAPGAEMIAGKVLSKVAPLVKPLLKAKCPPKVRIAPGAGYPSKTLGGNVYTGGYDPAEKALYLRDAGHPQGVAAAGGNPSAPGVAGVTAVDTGTTVLWNNASPSLPAVLTPEQRTAVQAALESAFPGRTVKYSPGLR